MSKHVETKAPVAGLLCNGSPVPLVGISVEAQVKDFCTRVVVTQRYRNDESQPIEAVYVFPIDEGAAVCGFEALIDDVLVVGEVQEREKAFEKYDDAIAAGHGAYLLDQDRPDVFTASIGNVAAGKEVSVRITYVAEIRLDGEDRCFVLPTTVSPRYAPPEDRTGIGQTPAERLNPPVDFHVPYGLELSVQIEMASAIRSVNSHSHPIGVEIDGTRATVRLGTGKTTLDRDFVLQMRVAGTDEPRSWVEVDERGRRAALVSFQPRFNVSEAPCEMIFLVDRSGSMAGTSIEEARNALQFSLRSLSAGCRFNIVGFGSTFEVLFPESRLYDDNALAEASAHVQGLAANLGGTEILAPLKEILDKKSDPELPRQLFIFTDGQVTNTEAVLHLVRRHSATTRVFTFGIGHGASRHLISGMARAGEGAAEFIAPGERLEEKVLRQLAKALAPALTDLQLNWDGVDVRQAPHHVPPVFAGGRVLIYGLLKDASAGKVRLSARGPQGPLTWEVRVDPEFATRGSVVGTLAARGLIRDLEEGMSSFHDRRGSLQDRNTKLRVKQEIVQLGIDYKLCSRETSLVAVEKRKKPESGEMKLRRVPVALTRDWGQLETRLNQRVMETRMQPAQVSLLRFMMSESADPDATQSSSIFGRLTDVARASISAKTTKRDSEICRDQTPLLSLIALQRADGSWELTPELAAVLNHPLRTLESLMNEVTGDPEEGRRACATALAVEWLCRKAAEQKDKWLLLERKARKWLSTCRARPSSGESWEDLAGRFLLQN